MLGSAVNDEPSGASSDGYIEAASGAGSMVRLDHADITGGLVIGGLVEVVSDATLDGGADSVSLGGAFAVDAGATLLLRGTIAGDAFQPTTSDFVPRRSIPAPGRWN